MEIPISTEYLQQRFALYNSLVFGGKLPPIEIRTSRAERALGKLEFRRKFNIFGKIIGKTDFLMRISTGRITDADELDDVILHEMIHYYIEYFNIGDTSSHGELFRRMMKTVNERYGRNVTVSRKRDFVALWSDGVRREHVFCISGLENGKRGITVCTREKAATIRKNLARFYRLASTEWYEGDSPILNRYPRSRSGRIYRLTAEDERRILKDATKFEFN